MNDINGINDIVNGINDIVNDILNDIMNNKKGHSIMKDISDIINDNELWIKPGGLLFAESQSHVSKFIAFRPVELKFT